MAVDLSGARRIVISLMADTCRIERAADLEDAGTFNDATGAITVAGATPIYAGPVMIGSKTARVATPGGQIVTESYWSAMIPWNAALPAEGDTLTVTAVGSSSDSSMVGRVFTIDQVDHSSFLAGRGLQLTSRTPTEPRDV